jgi:hypothetical protein
MENDYSLRILFTSNALGPRGGSELFVFDLAVALRKRGHRPVAFSTVLGQVAEQLNAAGVPAIDDLSSLTVRPDIIHGHHHLELATALLHFPDTPAVHVCHGWIPWEEAPLRFPTIQRYLAVSRLTHERLVTSGIPVSQTEIIPNFVDTERFRPRNRLPDRVTTAALFGNYFSKEHPHYLAIQSACLQLQFEKIDLFGLAAGTSLGNPEDVIPQYDVVFAVGRCALEALACGCAVILVDHYGLGGIVTLDNFEYLRERNFAFAATHGNRVTPARVIRELEKIDPNQVEAISRKTRVEASLSSAVEAWERIYIDAIESYVSNRSSDSITLAASDYLRKLSPIIKCRHTEWITLQRALSEAEQNAAVLWEKLAALEASTSWRATAGLRAIISRLPPSVHRQLVAWLR